MRLSQVVIKDIMRRKRRLLYAALGVIIGVTTVVGILTITDAGEERIYNQLEKYGPNLMIIPAINNLDMELGDLSLGTVTVGDNYIDEGQVPAIRKIVDDKIKKELNIKDEGNLATIAPNLFLNTEIDGVNVMMVGVDPQEEYYIKTWWTVQEGNYLETEDQVLVGSTAAELLKIEVGEKIPVRDTELTVVGVLQETGSNDDYQMFIPLETVQNLAGKEGLVSSIDVRALCNACPVEMIADDINMNIAGVRAVAVKQVAAAEMGVIDRMNRFMLALAGITLIVGLFGVVNTMMASVNERIKDIGIMKAVGASRNQIIKIFVYEAVMIGIVGGIFGYVFGTLLAYVIGPLIFEGTDIEYIPQYLPVSLGLATLIAVLAAVYPAFKTTRIKIADSFRAL